jgi:heme oxygenase (biliverdin-IX-beta and delta-forming)
MIDRLNEATRGFHADANQDFDVLFGDELTPLHYRTYLVRAYTFETPLEQVLAATPNLELMLDLAERRKAGFLAHDLVALGMPLEAIERLPRCAVPQFHAAAEALGWMYVVERTTLAHSLIRRHLLTRIPRELMCASEYLQCYAGVVGRRWRELGAVLDDVARQPQIADRIIAAAGEAFRAQQRHRAAELAPVRPQLRAV